MNGWRSRILHFQDKTPGQYFSGADSADGRHAIASDTFPGHAVQITQILNLDAHAVSLLDKLRHENF